MDEPRLTYSCGHSAEGRHFRGNEDARRRQREHFKKKLPSLVCRDCYRRSKDAEGKKAAEANRRAGLPKLIGTPREVLWAEQVRAAFYADLIAKGSSTNEARMFASACEDAVTWIDLRKLDAHALLEEFLRWDRVAQANEDAGLPELTCLGFCYPAQVRVIEDVRAQLLGVFAEVGATPSDAADWVSVVTDVDLWMDLLQLELADLAALLLNQAAGGTAVDDYLRARSEERRRDEQAMLAQGGPDEDDGGDPSGE